MFDKIIKIILIIFLYQTPLYSKNTSFDNFNSKNFSDYFSGIVALENRHNSDSLKFFESSKILLKQHNLFLKRYITTLVLENKIPKAINVVKNNLRGSNTDFFDAYLLLIIDSFKSNNFDQVELYLEKAAIFSQNDRFNAAIIETLKQYNFVFKEKKLIDNKKNFGTLSLIAETFQRCYLGDSKTENYFSNLINKNEADYSRYIYFYLSYLIQNKRFEEAKIVINDINYINSTLLLSQGKSWIENGNFEKFNQVFSCKNHNDILSEFLFLISNLYSSQDNFERSNFFLYLSNFLNSKFIYNFSLVVENYYYDKDYENAKKILKNFKKEDDFYYWNRKKKEAEIMLIQKNKKESLKFIVSEFKKIKEPNNKMIFDLANFYKRSKDYKTAIKYYSKVIENFSENSEIKSDLLYRRGGSYERSGDFFNADKDLLESLSINPDDAYVLNYLAYSWLERDYKIEEAMEMLKTAYEAENDDPYIIDSIGWAYYLIDDYKEAEKYLKRAVEMMPYDPIVNDHYGDILWKLDRKIQARYFWKNVLKMDDVEKEMIENIYNKLIKGPKSS
jgi:tetratricopeptide (TPR) repeat protein